MSKPQVVLVPTDAGGLAMTLAGGHGEIYPIPTAILEDQIMFHRATKKLQEGDLSFLDDWKQF
jgi:hypothetical protein